jgi:transcriptional regulator with XRE-family HTH domain
MIPKEKLIRTPEYHLEKIQNELFRRMNHYMQKENLNRTQLAGRLGVTKGYISQVMNGNFNFTLKKMIELSLAIGAVPTVNFSDLEPVISSQSSVSSTQYPVSSTQ